MPCTPVFDPWAWEVHLVKTTAKKRVFCKRVLASGEYYILVGLLWNKIYIKKGRNEKHFRFRFDFFLKYESFVIVRVLCLSSALSTSDMDIWRVNQEDMRLRLPVFYSLLIFVTPDITIRWFMSQNRTHWAQKPQYNQVQYGSQHIARKNHFEEWMHFDLRFVSTQSTCDLFLNISVLRSCLH